MHSVGEQPAPAVLWSMRYQQQSPGLEQVAVSERDSIITLPPLSQDLVLENKVIDDVKKAWQSITGNSNDQFLQFEAREGNEDEA